MATRGRGAFRRLPPLSRPPYTRRIDAPRLVPLAFDRLPPGEMLERSHRFLERLRQRRSVRAFSTEPVPWQVVENAIRAAAGTPSGANRQPWTFVAVEDAMTKRRIREAAEAEERRNYAARMSPEWLRALEPLGTDADKPHLEEAPLLIVVFEQAYGLGSGGEKIKNYYVRESVGIAVGFLLAALHDAGLATLTHTPSPMGFLRQLLGRPENERAYVVVPVGYPAAGATVPAIAKKRLEDVLVRR